MSLRSAAAVLLLAIMTSSMACRETSVSTGDILLTLDSLEHRLEWTDHRLALENWRYSTTGLSDSLEFFQDLQAQLLFDSLAFRNIRAGLNQLSDDEDLRRCSIIYSRLLVAQVEQVPQIAALRDTLASLISGNAASFEGQPHSREQLGRLFYYDSDRSRREMAFRAFNTVDSQAADNVAHLFRLRNQQARKLGYNDYFKLRFSLSEVSLDEYMSLLNNLDSATSQLYTQLINKTRSRSYNNDTEVWDLPGEWAEAYGDIDQYFPVDSQLPMIVTGLSGLGFNINKLAIYLKSVEAGDSPVARTYQVRPPYDTRMVVSLTDGLEMAFRLGRAFGTAIRLSCIGPSGDSYTHVQPAWGEAISDLMEMIVGQDEWLSEYVAIPDTVVARFHQADRKRQLFDLRMALTAAWFEYEAYRDSDRDLNKLYWDLFEKHMLLPRHDPIMAWASNAVFIEQPVSSPDHLLGKLIAAHTLAYIRKTNGSVVGNRETESFLVQNFYRFGGRFAWKETLQRSTGEPLNPDYFLESLL